MRAAPPAAYPVERLGVWTGAAAAVAGLSVAAGAYTVGSQLFAAGGVQQSADGWLLVAAGLLGGAVAAWRLVAAIRRPLMVLRWNGAGWHLRPLASPLLPALAVDDEATAGMPELMLDLGDALLLRWRNAQGRVVAWLPLSRHFMGTRAGASHDAAWHGLRVALHAPVRTPATSVWVQGEAVSR